MNKENELKILCPYCNKEFSLEMKIDLETGFYCDTCGPGNQSATIDIVCSNCNKLVYRKEYEDV